MATYSQFSILYRECLHRAFFILLLMKKSITTLLILLPLISFCQETFKGKLDSLWLKNGNGYQKSIIDGYELCKEFPNEKLAHEFVYNTRKFCSKDDLQSFINSTDGLEETSKYIKSLSFYVNNKQ